MSDNNFVFVYGFRNLHTHTYNYIYISWILHTHVLSGIYIQVGAQTVEIAQPTISTRVIPKTILWFSHLDVPAQVPFKVSSTSSKE